MNNEIIVKGLTTIKDMTFHDIEGGFGEDKKAMLVKDIAEIHGKDIYKINENINNNRKRFVDGIDIIDLKETEFVIRLVGNGVFTQNSINRANNIYMLSERGYAKLLKILEDDIAWEKYEILVDDYFSMRAGIKSICENLSPELQAIFVHDKKIQAVETRVDALENTMTVDYGQQLKLQNTANHTVIDILGGKDSIAYKKVGKRIFKAVWRDYKKRFNVASYKDTPVLKFDDSKKYLSHWTPDYNLLLEIKETNCEIAV